MGDRPDDELKSICLSSCWAFVIIGLDNSLMPYMYDKLLPKSAMVNFAAAW